MPLKDKISEVIETYAYSGHHPKQIDADLYEEIQSELGDGKLLKVMPYPENDGIEASEELFQSIHDLRSKWYGLKNVSSSMGFEIWFNDGKIQFMFYVRDERSEKKLRKLIDAYYPNAQIEEQPSLFPKVMDGDYVAGCELQLKQSKYYPVKSPHGVRDFISDPYKPITSDMIADDMTRTVVQVVFRPALDSWAVGGPLADINPLSESVEEVSDSLKQSQLLPGIRIQERQPTKEERELADVISEQENMPAYHMNLRIITLSQDRNEAESNAWGVAKEFEQSFKEVGDQTFVQQPARGWKLDRLVKRVARREWIDHDMILTIPEVASVAHIPNDSIETPSVDWNRTASGARIPADAERFDQDDTSRAPPGQVSEDESPTPDSFEPSGSDTSTTGSTGNLLSDVASDDEESESPDESNVETGTPEWMEDDELDDVTPDSPSESEATDATEENGDDEVSISSAADEEDGENSSSTESEGEGIRTTNDAVEESDEVWTKPEPGDDDYDPSKDNSNYTTGYDEERTDEEWTGGQARNLDQEDDFEDYEPPESTAGESVDNSETEDEQDSLEQAAVEGMMENDGNPPEFRDDRDGDTDTSDDDGSVVDEEVDDPEPGIDDDDVRVDAATPSEDVDNGVENTSSDEDGEHDAADENVEDDDDSDDDDGDAFVSTSW